MERYENETQSEFAKRVMARLEQVDESKVVRKSTIEMPLPPKIDSDKE